MVAKLSIADLLVEGARSSADLASATDSDAPALYRLLRAAAALGILDESVTHQFSLTPVGQLLRSDVPGSLRAFAIMFREPWFRGAWGDLLHSVRTGEAAFDHVHGMPLFEFLQQDREAAAVFNAAIGGGAAARARAALDAYDFAKAGTIADVGGGQGVLLGSILSAHSETRGVLFDRNAVVAGAREVLERMGVADRCEVVGGDFFTEVPKGADTYILSAIIHDWADEPAALILRSCRRSMASSARLLLVEQVVPEGSGYHPSKFDDLNMLVLAHGQERTETEYRTLLQAAGLELTLVACVGSPRCVVEARPA